MSRPRPFTLASPRPPRVLVVRLSALGDVIHALPVLPALRRAWPGAHVDWVVEDRAAAVLAHRPDLRRVIVFPRRALRAARGRPGARAAISARFAAELRAVRYDVALDLQGNLKSGVITRLSGARHRYGLDRQEAREGNHLFTTRRVRPRRAARHRVERNLEFVRAATGHLDLGWEDPQLMADPVATAIARDRLAEAGVSPEGPFVVMHPGTSAFGAFKRWPAERFGDLAARWTPADEPIVVTAPEAETALADLVARASGGRARRVVVDDLVVLGEILRAARLVVAADTGPLHLAALAGTEVIGLFGPKDGDVYGPYGRRRDGSVGRLAVVARGDVACRPCTLRRCADPVCMTGLCLDPP